MKKPYVLCIMDGFGYNPGAKGNAIEAANTPNLDRLIAENPHTLIGASGLDVGLPFIRCWSEFPKPFRKAN